MIRRILCVTLTLGPICLESYRTQISNVCITVPLLLKLGETLWNLVKRREPFPWNFLSKLQAISKKHWNFPSINTHASATTTTTGNCGRKLTSNDHTSVEAAQGTIRQHSGRPHHNASANTQEGGSFTVYMNQNLNFSTRIFQNLLTSQQNLPTGWTTAGCLPPSNPDILPIVQ